MGNFIGGIAGDIIGSVYEWRNATNTLNIEFFKRCSRFTDDTVLTCAVADWLMKSEGKEERESLEILNECLRSYGKAHPYAGYGHMFRDWLSLEEPKPMGSFGNGSGMRVSPVGFYAESEEECLKLAEWSAKVTHDHPEGIKGAQAIALAIYLARRGETKSYIQKCIEDKFGYDLNHEVWDYVERDGTIIISRKHRFDATCQTTVPEALVAFLRAESYDDAINNAIIIGGDTDTIADMAGAVAGAYFGVPQYIVEKTMSHLSSDLFDVVKKFEAMLTSKAKKSDKYLEVNAGNE